MTTGTRRLPLLVVMVAGGLTLARPADAQLGVNCTISAIGVAFGNYDVFSASALDSTGTVTYQCTVGVLIQVHLSRGSSATYFPRQMSSGSEALNYNLYSNAARTQVWGDGSGGTSSHSALATVLFPTNVTVYGRIPAQQNAAAGSFSDAVVATIIF